MNKVNKALMIGVMLTSSASVLAADPATVTGKKKSAAAGSPSVAQDSVLGTQALTRIDAPAGSIDGVTPVTNPPVGSGPGTGTSETSGQSTDTNSSGGSTGSPVGEGAGAGTSGTSGKPTDTKAPDTSIAPPENPVVPPAPLPDPPKPVSK